MKLTINMFFTVLDYIQKLWVLWSRNWQGDGMANPWNGDSVKLLRFAKKWEGAATAENKSPLGQYFTTFSNFDRVTLI